MKISKINNLILLVLVALVFSNCSETTTPTTATNTITDKKDFQAYLQLTENKQLISIQSEIDFWQAKFDAAPNQSSYLITLASYYSQLFEITGTIAHLYEAEQLLLQANEKFVAQDAGIHRAIARNYISQHRFKEALTHLEKAENLGENKIATNKMLFDVHMELGNYELAKDKLSVIQIGNDFDYHIRVAKWNDHKGNLDAAIASMEKAMKIAEVDKNKALKIWVYSNIGDFYGHAGRIEDSYKYYLKTLNVDPNNTYALKGIAWIAFSHERNPQQALEIISAIETKKAMPDLYLLKAEIAAFQKNELEEEKAISTYNEMLAVHNYGEMYNSYNVLLLAEKPRAVEDAIKIAQLEVQNRPTPESYDLLAWSYFKSGDKEKALEIIKMHTLGKSFEPTIVYHAAEILKANAKYSDITPMKEELLASIYELGPGLEEQINSL